MWRLDVIHLIDGDSAVQQWLQSVCSGPHNRPSLSRLRRTIALALSQLPDQSRLHPWSSTARPQPPASPSAHREPLSRLHTSGTSLRSVGGWCPRRSVFLVVTMSIRRMTLGAGFRYLMSSVARMDQTGPASGLTGYYAAQGTPPGRFLGRGLAGFNDGKGVEAGSLMTEEHLWRMLGMLADPVTGQPLGRPPAPPRTQCIDRLGRVRRVPKTVAGFDLTFSAPKSVSVAWALADELTRERIRSAHRRALEQVITYAEKQVFATRIGGGGVVSEDVRGVVAAAFEHWDSRTGDPQLHTHVVVLNRVQAVLDGKWRTLDSKALFKATVGLSELYNGVLADLLTLDLGWGWTPEQRRRSSEPKWEVTGVDATLRDEFSQRTSAVETAKDALVEEFVASHGRQPTSREVLQMRQRATLATRPDKHVKPLHELLAEWEHRAEPHIGSEPAAWVSALAGRNDLPLLNARDLDPGMLAEVAAQALAKVADKRATFTRGNVLAEVLRTIHGVRFADPANRAVVAERTTTVALDRAVMLTPPEVGIVPESLRRADGTSKFRARSSEIYTTQELLDAEERLLAAGRTTSAPRVHPSVASAATAGRLPGQAHPLSAEQRAAVTAVVTSGRVLDVLVGPAGTGKSTTMAGVRAAWEAAFGPGSVVGLAPSAAAADVLAEAVGVPTENTAKWLTEQASQPQRCAQLEQYAAQLDRVSPSLATRALRARATWLLTEYQRWVLTPGRLVIVDEASMAGTRDLHQITNQAAQVGAKVLLVGDWAQLSPVQAGGAFRLLATDRDDTPTLHDVRRFRHEWERDASLALRDGKLSAAETHIRHGRVKAGGREDMLDLLVDAWLTDTTAGLASLMLAADTQTVNDLNARARRHRVGTGQVSTDREVTLADRSRAGVGDLVLTRHNHRDLTLTGPSGGWIKNGDEWVVLAIGDDSTLTVRRRRGSAIAVLPAEYVRDHLELGYASTAHRAQGRTVTTAHVYLSAATPRESLYVMATRGRENNQLYLDVTYDPNTQTSHQDPNPIPAEDILRSILANSGADRSAHEERAAEERTYSSATRLTAEAAVTISRTRAERDSKPSPGRSWAPNGTLLDHEI